MPIVDLEQEFAASVLNEALDKLCHRFAWSRSEAYDFLLGSAVAWRVRRGQTDARVTEKFQQILAECRASGAPSPPSNGGDGSAT